MKFFAATLLAISATALKIRQELGDIGTSMDGSSMDMGIGSSMYGSSMDTGYGGSMYDTTMDTGYGGSMYGSSMDMGYGGSMYGSSMDMGYGSSMYDTTMDMGYGGSSYDGGFGFDPYGFDPYVRGGGSKLTSFPPMVGVVNCNDLQPLVRRLQSRGTYYYF